MGERGGRGRKCVPASILVVDQNEFLLSLPLIIITSRSEGIRREAKSKEKSSIDDRSRSGGGSVKEVGDGG